MADDKLVCPECGKDMSKLNKVAHALEHYPEYLDPARSGKLARKRQALILAGGVPYSVYVAEHKEDQS